MDAKEVLVATEVCLWLSGRAADLPGEGTKGVEMQLHLTIAATYLWSYAKEIDAGKDAFDALCVAAQGTTPFDDSPSLTVFNLLRAKPRPDDSP